MSEEMVLVKFPDGQKNHFPASVANDNKKLKEFVRGMGFSELAEAKIERSKDKDGKPVVTFVKQAGKKGGSSALAALIKAKPFNNPAVMLAERIEAGEAVPSARVVKAASEGAAELERTMLAADRLATAVPACGAAAEEI